MTVFVYVNTNKQVGDADHLKVFANQDAVGPRQLCRDRGVGDMDRERARLLIRNQQREQQRSRSPRAAGLRSFLAPHQSQPDCHPGRRITL